ncbi:MAG TPA: tetratricopeptide repeat protein [Syntrophales bacterium]|nr:tetratricopeptide repeat protein [Syntrophales bacterium]
MQNLIVITTIGFLLFGIYKRELRISHAILVVGAIFLLTRHSRFTCEFTLLSLPLLRHIIPLLSKAFVIPSRVICVLLPVVLVIMPYCIYHGVLGDRPHYPLSPSNLPTGVSRFLNQHSLSGNILNDPNTGGYLQWTLSDRYRIYMDMQMSIFNDLDLALVEHSFTDKHAFASFIKKYDPSFITVSLNRTSFKDIINTQEQYCPVFFDHAEVLYVNRNHYREVADKYELKLIDPFIYWKTLYANESATSILEISNEAKRMRSEDPSNFRVNHILSSLSVTRGEYREALEYAKQIIKYYPEQYQGYALMGDALFGTKEYHEAIVHYKMALAMGAQKQSDKVYWNLYASYYNIREYKKAYIVLMKYVNPFSPEATYEEIYQLAISAALLGKKNEALLFFKIASMKIPDNENILKVKVDDYIKQLTNDDK